MKTWIWVLIGVIVFIVTAVIGVAMYRRNKGTDETDERMEKVRLAKKMKAEQEAVDANKVEEVVT